MKGPLRTKVKSFDEVRQVLDRLARTDKNMELVTAERETGRLWLDKMIYRQVISSTVISSGADQGYSLPTTITSSTIDTIVDIVGWSDAGAGTSSWPLNFHDGGEYGMLHYRDSVPDILLRTDKDWAGDGFTRVFIVVEYTKA
jgi:hypothetical protein